MGKPCSSKLIPMAGFQKGQSGNPKGRRKAHLGCQKLRDLISDHSESLIKRLLLSAVNDGDVAAAKLLIDRAIPPLKSVELPTPIAIPPDGSLAEQGRAVVLALSRGKLPASQAGALLQGLATPADPANATTRRRMMRAENHAETARKRLFLADFDAG